MNTTCACCGQKFDSLSHLMNHMKVFHTAEEIMSVTKQLEEEPPKVVNTTQ